MTDTTYMKLALQLASATNGQTNPNPMVGAVVVKNGEIVGVGAHLRAGEAHAEVHALQMAGEKAQGATLYVTLEPCNHFGKTPPCTEQIIQSGIARVVIATQDNNPLVAGSGIKKLQEASIMVETGLLAEEATQLNNIFFHTIQHKKPYVTLKTAMSLDGKIASTTGESKWITGSQARMDVHQYRHQHDAILVGVNTIIADNPSLTTRLPNGGKNPIRIILDTHLRTPLSAKVLHDNAAPTWLVTGASVSEEQIRQYESYASILSMPTERISVPNLLQVLYEQGISSLFVEGGSQIHASFIESHMYNQLVIYMSGHLIGGQQAPTFFGGTGFSLQDAPKLYIASVEQMGDDIKLIARRKEENYVYRHY
ncbi:bifunctional diaminohydroxyphosphoribosylaminopyrimidine deaminase/5-amino-6-(5-phosphoribosylamino)uracil reductase RibD [Ectobacillus antri]|uniref:bifunctional diaminohydroxyphosphoribosylaminopyrimidine deaminase/5-amino-6-(5-phosphoribosylamino)uracil reductase RibD n=1 Tax=Ectobacillus antri TaxID=2486280 RepID=UPI000F593494|nr:bifunctional diaminohydroxyphosphoribosylaminopyrimidine deaminase/5-amino-6-(5-phosphoribosylamino)uracil reductase RibD [Ectobacillus antri]